MKQETQQTPEITGAQGIQEKQGTRGTQSVEQKQQTPEITGMQGILRMWETCKRRRKQNRSATPETPKILSGGETPGDGLKRFRLFSLPHSAVALVVVAVGMVAASYWLPIVEPQPVAAPAELSGEPALPVAQPPEKMEDNPAVATEKTGAGASGNSTAAKVEIVAEDGTVLEQSEIFAAEEGVSFAEYRLKRAKARAAAEEVLQEVIDDAATTEEMRSQAQQQRIAQSLRCEEELMIENLLQVRYGGEALVFLGPLQATAVLQSATTPTSAEMALAAQLVAEYGSIAYENVVILVMD